MKKWKLATGLLMVSPYTFAGSVDTLNADITLAGGASAGYYYTVDPGNGNHDDYHLSDFLLEVTAKNRGGGMANVAAVGGLGLITDDINIFNGGVNIGIDSSPAPFYTQYGWLQLEPMPNSYVQAGILATKIGYEAKPYYANPNATHSALWTAQPVYYPGVRLGFNWQDMANVFVEANNDTSTGDTGTWAAGLSGNITGFTYSVAYESANKARSIADLILASTLSNVDLALNFDYNFLDSRVQTGTDDAAWGIDVYVIPKFGAASLPLRFGYVNDGDTGVYRGVNTAFTVTATPTYNFNDFSFARFEVAYISADKSFVTDNSGGTVSSKTSFSLTAGMRF